MAMISQIQRFSIHDGPGIRSTVFFKGCHLHCWWCHNPESWTAGLSLMYNFKDCIGCGACTAVCHCHNFVNNIHTIDRTACICCSKCVEVCPTGALNICGREMSGEELLQELEKDRVFYEASGGGVTFSGGECLDQLDFLEKVLKNCQENHLHTAIDTTGDADYFILDKLFLLSNLILYDFKCFSDDLHTQGTGVSNCRILENLSRLLENYPEKIWIRIPVIPLFNTCDREMKKMAEFLASRNRPARIELLPYHRLGEAKCIALGFADTIFPNPPSEEEMKKFRAMFDLPIESMVFS